MIKSASSYQQTAAKTQLRKAEAMEQPALYGCVYYFTFRVGVMLTIVEVRLQCYVIKVGDTKI